MATRAVDHFGGIHLMDYLSVPREAPRAIRIRGAVGAEGEKPPATQLDFFCTELNKHPGKMMDRICIQYLIFAFFYYFTFKVFTY